MNFGMLPQDLNEYVKEVKGYVDGLIYPSLLAEVDLDKPREQRNRALYAEIINNPELKNTIVNKIVERGIRYSMVAYKTNLPSNLRKQVFMRKIYSFLNMYQISLLVDYFYSGKDVVLEQKQSREDAFFV